MKKKRIVDAWQDAQGVQGSPDLCGLWQGGPQDEEVRQVLLCLLLRAGWGLRSCDGQGLWFEEKERGHVVSRDFKIGDLILMDNAVVSMPEHLYPPWNIASFGEDICKQLQVLPEVVREEFLNLKIRKQ